MMRVLIVAPHADDEVIGCWSIMSRPDIQLSVLYLYELTPVRIEEVRVLANAMVFEPFFRPEDVDFTSYAQVYVPSRKDWHAAHKEANRLYRKYATHFYSVDMEQGVTLPEPLATRKRGTLDAYYPSQRKLWDTNDKYWLFEDIQGRDFEVYTFVPCCLASYPHRIVDPSPHFTVRCRQEYAPAVQAAWCALEYSMYPRSLTEVVNWVVGIGIKGKITIQYQGLEIEV